MTRTNHNWPYDKTFAAIAASTEIVGGNISVSVEKFANSFGSFPTTSKTEAVDAIPRSEFDAKEQYWIRHANQIKDRADKAEADSKIKQKELEGHAFFVGKLSAIIPISKAIPALSTLGTMVEYFKNLQFERDDLMTRVAALNDECGDLVSKQNEAVKTIDNWTNSCAASDEKIQTLEAQIAATELMHRNLIVDLEEEIENGDHDNTTGLNQALSLFQAYLKTIRLPLTPAPRAQALEEAARVCDGLEDKTNRPSRCAAAIRALSSQPVAEGPERGKFYHKHWELSKLLEARNGGLVDHSGGEAWRYEYTSKDEHGKYDMLYRHNVNASVPARLPASPGASE